MPEENDSVPGSLMKNVVAARLFSISFLAAIMILPAVRCGAAPALIHYQRLLYLPPPPGYSEGKGLIQGHDGWLYGIVHSRTNTGGVIFRVKPDGSDYLVIYSSLTNRPGGVIQGRDGWLYGTIASTPTTSRSDIFRMDRDGGNFTSLLTFSSDHAHFGVVQDSEGWLYGTTGGNALENGGSVFKLATNGTGFQVLHRFGGAAHGDGLVPGALTLGRDGLLYGCTFYGGSFSDSGTVFKLGRDGADYVVLRRFGGGSPGHYPAAHRPLLEGSDGFLYGAADGGVHRAGVIFKLNKSGGGFQTIHEFQGDEGTGDSPLGGLVEWCDGALYGATHEGGIDGAGILFRLNKDGTGFVVLHVYIDAPNPGATEGSPRTSLLPAADGRLYGLTSGGSVAEGTVYRISPRPTLNLRPGLNEVILSWLACPEEYVLEESGEFSGPEAWQPVDAPVEVVGASRQVVLPRSAERRFFRLRQF